MTTCLGKSYSFGLPRVPFVNCCQFMYLVISLLVLRAGCGIWLYRFLIIAYLFYLETLQKWKLWELLFQRNNVLNTGPFMTVTVHDSENTTTVLTLDFPLNVNTLDIFTPQEMIHMTHNENDATKQPMKTSAKKKLFGVMIQHLFLCYWFFQTVL